MFCARCTAYQERSPPGADSPICANSALAGPIELITLRDEPPRKRLLATAGQALAAVLLAYGPRLASCS